MTNQRPIREGLFTWPAERPQLLGSRCRACGEMAFPSQNDCRHCCGSDTEIVELGDRGTLWTWTIQSFMPKSPYHSDETPETFRPYGVGYIEMPGGLRVEARLKENKPEELAIGQAMSLSIEPFRRDEDGTEVLAFAFQRSEENA
ncbi:Zn-ribbon domain-containing OB-fold protein [Parahaliea aestuarii]|uniref:DNA-binding protein n=1 Tax=Parahaliea aestuarii TaxID=1852021 RepID=A0A5C9A2V3_9GAMM|nr:OB-fold domain-containing protein [Parahaliea aestuarii]TXS95046.1 DNA-binding protein [Parahaliea aestuarii]